MSAQPESPMLRLLRDMRAEIGDVRAEMATKADVADLHPEMTSLHADVASDMIALEARQDAQHKQTREQVVGLRRAVVECHTSVIGHGIIISDLEARLRRGWSSTSTCQVRRGINPDDPARPGKGSLKSWRA